MQHGPKIMSTGTSTIKPIEGANAIPSMSDHMGFILLGPFFIAQHSEIIKVVFYEI